MSRPIVALLTDFGSRDHYVAAMKGVVLGVAPDVTLVDITHEIPPQDVQAASLELAACYRYFPTATVFVVVVDPGVGTSRRALAAEAGEYRFVAPDNGVLSGVFADAPPRRVVELSERAFARPTISRTFEGRDRFAPAAAWLAKGSDLSALGRPLSKWEVLPVRAPVATGEQITGEVVRVDRFGNLVTNIHRRMLEQLGGRLDRGDRPRFDIRAAGRPIARFVATYAEVAPGELCALFGSSEHLEISANRANAAEELAAGRGAVVTVAVVK